MNFSSEFIDSSPSHSFQKRLAEEKKINVYFVPGKDKLGQSTYLYAVASAALHDQFMKQLATGEIADFAVIVEMGTGEPTAEVKAKIKTYYGFDHDFYANNDNVASGGGDASA